MSSLMVNFTDNLALVTLNRPGMRNALDDRLILELRDTAGSIEEDPGIRAVILTGAGKAFCSGMDLAYLRKLADFDEGQNREDSENLVSLYRAIRESRLPWIAAVNGPAVAGGCGLATACDLIMADREQARFGYTETLIGFIPAIVSGLLLSRVGETHARDLLLSGRIIKARAAMEMGLVNELSESGQVVALAGARAQALAGRCSRNSIGATKELLEKIRSLPLDEAFRVAVDENVRLRMSDSCKKGVSAFLEKQKLDWRKID